MVCHERDYYQRIPEVKQALIASIEDTKTFMYSLFMCLKLKDEPFYAACEEDTSFFSKTA